MEFPTIQQLVPTNWIRSSLKSQSGSETRTMKNKSHHFQFIFAYEYFGKMKRFKRKAVHNRSLQLHCTVILRASISFLTFWHNKCWDSCCSDGRADCITFLIDIDTSVPATPGLCGSEHTSSTAHVSERTLAGPVGSTSTHTRDTCHGTTSSPWFSTCLVSCIYK